MAEERAQRDAHAVDEVLPVGRMAAFGLQHVLSMYAGIIAVPLLGLVAGTILAAVLGLADFARVGDAAWVGVTLPFHFGLPTFALIPIVSMTLVMLIVMVETTADILAIGEIVEKPLRPDDVARDLRADGLSTAFGAVFNSFPFTAFAQNVGLVRFTNVKSRFVVAVAGVILLFLRFFPKLAALVASIPLPVLGGEGSCSSGPSPRPASRRSPG